MGYVESTGNNHEDIASVMEQVNLINNSSNTTGQLNLATFGTIKVAYTGVGGLAYVSTATHNLGYPPIFFIRNIGFQPNGTDISFVQDAFISSYTFSSGPKASGYYPAGSFLFSVDNTKIFARYNVPSTTLAGFSGDFYFQYFIFSLPIGQKA